MCGINSRSAFDCEQKGITWVAKGCYYYRRDVDSILDIQRLNILLEPLSYILDRINFELSDDTHISDLSCTFPYVPA